MISFLLAVAAERGGPGTNVPARPVRSVKPGYVLPMTTSCEHARSALARWLQTSYGCAAGTQDHNFESGVWPQSIKITRSQDNYAIELNFDEVKQNNTVDKRAFVLENIEKLPERNLDGPQEPSHASPEQ